MSTAEQETTVAQHTPGPWVARPQHQATGRGGRTPGKVLGWIVEFTEGRGGRIGWPSLAWEDTNEGAPGDHPENEANARLIAAAPDLLEACRGVDVLYAELHKALGGLVGDPSYDIVIEAVRKARTAIAKAEGRDG